MMLVEIETISDNTGCLGFFSVSLLKHQAPISNENVVPQLFY